MKGMFDYMRPDDYVKFCPVCNKTKQNTELCMGNEKFIEFTKGYFYLFEPKNGDSIICPCCGQGKLENSLLTFKEFRIIDKISDSNRNFLEAMVKLKQEDIIEYEGRMSQFRNQLAQQEQFEKQQQQDSNSPHCPTCGSFNLEKISTSSKIMDSIIWGIGGAQRYKTYHCNNCGYEW